MMNRYSLFALIGCLAVAPSADAQYQNYQNSGFAGTGRGSSFSGGFSNFNSQTQQVTRSSAPSATGMQSNSTMGDLEKTLDAVDRKDAWNSVPVSGVANRSSSQYISRSSANPSNQTRTYSAPHAMTYATQGGVRRSYPVSTPTQAMSQRSYNSGSGMFPGVSRQEMLRVFIEGGMPDSSANQGYRGFNPAPSASGKASSNNTNVYYDYQTAENESTKSRNYSNTARYDKDKWNRKNAASQAEYAANNAEYAAQRAESASYNGDAQAKSYANLARQAANRARYNANQARYNANTIP